MGQRSGDRCGGRRAPRAAVVALAVLVVVLAGCGATGGGDGAAPADAESTTTPPTTVEQDDGAAPGEGTESTLATTSTTTPASEPEGSVKVPIDDELVARLPQLEGGGRQVVADEAFDERFCDGTKAPSVPKAQARATYPISATDVITVAAYRFAAQDAPTYLSDYAVAVRACAVEAGESEGLPSSEVFGSSFPLTTERGDAFIAMALYDDVLWVLFQESTAGPVEVDPSTLDGFLVTALG